MTSGFDRRAFLLGLAGTLSCAAWPRLLRADYSYLLEGVLLVDGSGSVPTLSDVGLRDGRVQTIAPAGALRQKSAVRRISGAGLVLAPGFIDLHSHSELTLLEDGRQLSKLYQGITLEVIGQDGRSAAPSSPGRGSFSTFPDFFRALRRRGMSVHVMTAAGAGTIRGRIMGTRSGSPQPDEQEEMEHLARRAHRDGAMFLSSGLEYTPGAFASSLELDGLLRAMDSPLYMTHIRDEGPALFSALKEAIMIARAAGSPLHISHLKLQGRSNHGRSPELKRFLLSELGRHPFSADVYPYHAYSTGLTSLYPLEARNSTGSLLALLTENPSLLRSRVEAKVAEIGGWQEIRFGVLYRKAHQGYQSKTMQKVAREQGMEPYDLLRRTLLAEGGAGSLVAAAMRLQDVDELLAFPFCAVATDAAGQSRERVAGVHPRAYGSMPRFFQRMVQKQKKISLAEAIRKISGLPARILGLRERGLVREGYHADLVLFDPLRFRDQAHYDHGRFASGVEWLFVGGEAVLEWGQYTSRRPGRILR
ncbi:MAG: amidohydrolase family protein [Spirochaetales bacterium]|nr:amidohydrolase family protein [Spirochaetales bacterium]